MKKFILSIMAAALMPVLAMAQGCPTPSSVNATVAFMRSKDGAFSVSPDKKVTFALGNLQYQASTGKWRFAAHQYDRIGNAAGNKTASGRDTQSDWIDLFGWGTSGWNNTTADATSVHYQPWETCKTNHSTANNNYQYGPSLAKVAANESWSKSASYERYDWGVYNSASLGSTGWRTLTKNEWNYLLVTRSTTSGVLYAKATVNGITGLIILPDNWNTSYYALSNANTANAAYNSNILTTEEWATDLEGHGAVFLPTAGNRDGTGIYYVGSRGYYWSSTASSAETAHILLFYESNVNPVDAYARYYGFSVRLVKDI